MDCHRPLDTWLLTCSVSAGVNVMTSPGSSGRIGYLGWSSNVNSDSIQYIILNELAYLCISKTTGNRAANFNGLIRDPTGRETGANCKVNNILKHCR